MITSICTDDTLPRGGAAHHAVLEATLFSLCAHCSSRKPPAWLPFCAACYNQLPLAIRQDLLYRINELAEAYVNGLRHLHSLTSSTKSDGSPT